MPFKAQKEREKLIEKESTTKSEGALHKRKQKVRTDLGAANELLDATISKLDDYLSSTPLSKKCVIVAKVMLGTTKTKCQDGIALLDKIRRKQKSLDRTTCKLLGKAVPSKIVEK